MRLWLGTGGDVDMRDANLTLLPPKTKYETPAAKTEWGGIALDPYYEGEGRAARPKGRPVLDHRRAQLERRV